MNNHALTIEQVQYVLGERGKQSATTLARELGCNRGVITGHWKRDKDGTGRCVLVAIDNAATNETILNHYQGGMGATEIAGLMGLTVTSVEHKLKRLRKRHGIAPHKRWNTPARSKLTKQPIKKEHRVIGMDGKPLPFYARPVPTKEGVMPISFEELDDIATGSETVCRCRHYVGSALATPTQFCGEPSEPGRPFCDFHIMIAYRANTAVPLDDKRKEELKHIGADFLRWRKAKDELPVAA